MRPFRDIHIKQKLTLVIMLTSGTALLLACAAFVVFDLVTFRATAARETATLANVIGANSAAALAFDDEEVAREILSALKAEPQILAACIYKRDGTLFATYSRGQAIAGGVWPELPNEGQRFADGHLELSRRIFLNREQIGTIYLRSDLREVRERMRRYVGIVLVVTLASLLVALLLSARLQRLVSAPILRLAGVARVVTEQKDYSIRAHKHSEDETGLLIETFNQMLGQIQQRDEALRTANDRLEQRVQERTKELRQELTERRRAEEEVRLLQTMTAAIAAAENFHSAVGLALQRVCEATGWIFGQSWIPRPDGSALECGPAWHKPSAALEKFRAASQRFTFAPGIGLPGRVWATKQPLWLRDVTIDSNFPRAPFARESGLKAGMALPVMAKDSVVAVIEFFVTESHGEDERLLRLVSSVTAQLGSLIERKQAEEALHQSEELLRHSQKMEAIGRLAGGVAHDFNNLLTVITGYCDLLLRRVTESDPQHKNIEEIHKAAERASSLTRQLLAFSRKQVLQPRIVDVSEIVGGMEKMLRRLIGEHIELRTALDRELWTVRADAGQLEQVIMNLAVNARDAMPKGGLLTIETANVTLDEESCYRNRALDPGEYVMLAVNDTGIGMSESVKTHLFEPFFTTKGPGEGTGLGLATCYGIIKQSGGDIRVYTEPDRGTTFKIYLPRVQEQAVRTTGPHVPEHLPHGTETILLVEDETAVRELAAFVLRECGYIVHEAENGEDGLRLVVDRNAPKFDLVISDMIMPRLNGKELVERLTLRHPDTRVLFISGYTADALAGQGALNAAVDFLEKPFSPRRLAQKVREILDRSDLVVA